MNNLLFLLYCTEVLGVLLFMPGVYGGDNSTQATNISLTTSQDSTRNLTNSEGEQLSINMGIYSSEPQTVTSTIHPSTSPSSSTTLATDLFFKKECSPLIMTSGILILVCTGLLISTVICLCKICHLSRRLKALNSNGDLISNSEYWMGTDKKNKTKSETEVKETTVLMADMSQTQDETNNGTVKEDGGKVNEDEQKEAKKEEKKEVDDTANNEEASATPVTMAENISSSEPQEEATDSQADKAVETTSSEDKEEPDVEKK